LPQERLPKPPAPEPGPMDHGYTYRKGPEAPKGGLTDSIARRKARRRGY
jgi:hypothetical protein